LDKLVLFGGFVKNHWRYIFAVVLVLSIIVLAFLTRSIKSLDSQSEQITAVPLNLPCPPDAFTLKSQPGATIQLNVVEANCNGTRWNAQLTLKNVGQKPVRGYEVANLADYQYKKNSESSQGLFASAGVLLPPGATKTLNFDAGFTSGLSYGKPTGSIEKNLFWVKRVEYSDQTSWRDPDQNSNLSK
jgi:hypothetical protein